MRAVESEYEAVSGSIRIAESELEMECGKIAQLRPGGSRVGPQSWSRDEMITCVKKADQSARLMNMINEEANLINAKVGLLYQCNYFKSICSVMVSRITV